MEKIIILITFIASCIWAFDVNNLSDCTVSKSHSVVNYNIWEHYLELNRKKSKQFRERNPDYNKERLKNSKRNILVIIKNTIRKRLRGTSC